VDINFEKLSPDSLISTEALRLNAALKISFIVSLISTIRTPMSM
jgi:hypothetical protein